MQQINQPLGQVLDQARRDNGYSYRQLAITTGIPITTIRRLCTDEVRSPRAAHLARLAEQLELPLDEIFALAGMTAGDYQAERMNRSLDAHLRAEFDLTEWETREARQAIIRLVKKHRARQERIQDSLSNHHPIGEDNDIKYS